MIGNRARLPASTLIVICLSLLAACERKQQESPASASAPAVTPESTGPAATPVAAPAPAVQPPAVTQAAWTPDALEELLAPIALYPDQLLAQVLAASVNPQEVLDGGNWLLQHTDLNGDQLDSAAQAAGFGPAMRALVQFPTVVDMLCQQIDWTRQLGSAFTSDQKSVLDAVQRLRTQAAQVGNLKSTPQQTVQTKQENDKVIVEVKPADPKVVYVPRYDPQAAYAPPPHAASNQAASNQATSNQPTSNQTLATTSTDDSVSKGTAVAAGVLAFGVGVVLGHAMADDDDCYPHWGSGVVYYGPHPFYPPAYVYRPVYGPAFHPAYRYAPPPGYRHSYNRVDVDVNRNVVINNNNYFNRFENNRNLRVDAPARSPIANTRVAEANRAAPRRPAAADDWKGRSTYAGARPDARRDTPANQALPRRPNTPATPEPHARPADIARNADRRPTDIARDIDRRPADAPHVARQSVQREQRDSGTEAARAQAEQPVRPVSRDRAFSGANDPGSGSFERAASARGNASMGARHERVVHDRRR